MVNGQSIKPLTEILLNVNDEIIFGKNLQDSEFRFIFCSGASSVTSPTTSPRARVTTPRATKSEIEMTGTPRFDESTPTTTTRRSSNTPRTPGANTVDLDALKKMIQQTTADALMAQRLEFEKLSDDN